MTSYIWALDDRPAAAAPVCYVTRLLCNTENELAADAEQIPPNFLREGLDIADLFIARIPKPVILLGQKNDFFDRRGLEVEWETAAEAPAEALVNSLAMALPFEPAEKQALLEARTCVERREILIAMMRIDAAAPLENGDDDDDTPPSMQ